MSIQAMKMALEALETCAEGDYSTGHVIHPSFDEKAVTDAITALRAAITEAERQEPVFVVFDGPPSHDAGRFVEVETVDGKSVSVGEWENVGSFWNLGPLYTNPLKLANDMDAAADELERKT